MVCFVLLMMYCGHTGKAWNSPVYHRSSGALSVAYLPGYNLGYNCYVPKLQSPVHLKWECVCL